jgi:hypothetical protein
VCYTRWGGQVPPGSAIPSVSCQLAERTRRVTVDQQLDIVKRRIGVPVRIDTPLVSGTVLRGIPSTAAQIDAANKRNIVVDNDDLLVVGPS